VIIALGGITLLALVGLAIDGGMAAGAYRHAQNAADAGALAAARQELLNALASPSQPSNSTTLTPVAQTEVAHNHAALLDTTSGPTADAGWGTMQTVDGMGLSYSLAASLLGSLFTSSQTTYVPNTASGLQATGALADVWTTAGTLLLPENAHMELVGAHSTASMRLPSGGGSIATAQVDLGMGEAPANSQLGYASCWTATAQYTAGTDVVGPQSACPAGTMPPGVTIAGALATTPGADARVGADDHPSAAPVTLATAVAGQDGVIAVGSALAGSRNVLGWSSSGLTSYSSTYALNVSLTIPSLNLDVGVDVLAMLAAVSVDSLGNTHTAFVCLPANVSVTDTVSHLTTTGQLTASCTVPGLSVAGVSIPWVQPASSPVCSTDSSTGTVSCGYQTCFLHASLGTTPYPTTICLGEDDVVLGATPQTITSTCQSSCGGGSSSSSSSSSTSSGSTTSSSSTTSSATSTSTSSTDVDHHSSSSSSSSSSTTSTSTTTSSTTTSGPPPSPWFTQFTGTVTVSAQVDQPTYFLNVLGWTHTTPSATASADLEAVVDESQASFAASPFAVPDTATNMVTPPYNYEHLRPGQTYYLYGPAMQTDDPAPIMPSSWEGQLSASSPHRVGDYLSGSATTTLTPQPYLPDGSYYLVPIFDPLTGFIESYGVFVPVSGHPNWGTLVNSVPSFAGQPNLHGYVVQATSIPGWISFDEGAVSVKLLQ